MPDLVQLACVLPLCIKRLQGASSFINGTPVRLSVHIVTYAQRKRPELEPARPLDPRCGPIVWRGQMESGYWLGTTFIKAPEDEVPVTFHYEPAYEGDIDIQLHMGLESTAPIDELTQLAREISVSLLAYVNLCFGELAAPVAPIQFRELKDGQSRFDSAVLVEYAIDLQSAPMWRTPFLINSCKCAPHCQQLRRAPSLLPLGDI